VFQRESGELFRKMVVGSLIVGIWCESRLGACPIVCQLWGGEGFVDVWYGIYGVCGCVG